VKGGLVKLTVNGRTHEIDAEADTPLLYVLRDDLALNGAKYGCGVAQCGSCVVIVGDEARPSCVVSLREAEGLAIRTVEGLGTASEPGPMQQAFIDEQAAQCGYCIPGIMMRAQALLETDPDADDAAIRAALEPHLCRCGAHNRILKAVARAGELMRGDRT
jgi:nicotinate dehydrogenase subunit A